MAKHKVEDIRTVALVGHGAVGKTSLADALLFAAKAVDRRGSVEEGSSVSDFDEEEKKRKFSIDTSVLHLEHKGKQLYLLDTPGKPDFVGSALEALNDISESLGDLRTALNDASSTPLRVKAARLLRQSSATAAQRVLLEALPTAPGEIAAEIASSLTSDDKGTAALLDLIEHGKAAVALLRRGRITAKLASPAWRREGNMRRWSSLNASAKAYPSHRGMLAIKLVNQP